MERPSPRWEDPRTVAGFTSGTPNAELLAFAERFVDSSRRPWVLDVGGGAARNAIPLAEKGFRVAMTDLSAPMLAAAKRTIGASKTPLAVEPLLAPMARLPFRDRVFDLVVAHGIWNLARSTAEFRVAVGEAARVARSGAGLFLFTFSRHTLPPEALPDAGETFVFSSWNGEPACFLSEEEIVAELSSAGFVRDGAGPMKEHNSPRPGELPRAGPPVIYEATFLRR